jgi:hypothetical protein
MPIGRHTNDWSSKLQINHSTHVRVFHLKNILHQSSHVTLHSAHALRPAALRLQYVDLDITSNTFYKCTATFRTQIYKKCLRIKLNGFRHVSTLVDITSYTFYKCTATFRTQIYKKCLLIKLNGFRHVSTLVDITSNTFYKCTATFRTQRIMGQCFYEQEAESITNRGWRQWRCEQFWVECIHCKPLH